MKSFLPFLSVVLFFASCSTAYKTGQTPDDVYFSPQRPQDEYVRVESNKNKYQYDEQNNDDRYLRMKVHNRRMWSDLDYYYSDPYAFNYYNNYNRYYGTPWNSYTYWNYYYNPYSPQVILINPKTQVYNKPRAFNLNVFNDPQQNNTNPKFNGPRVYNTNTSNNTYTPARNNAGSVLRNVFSSNESGSSSSSTPVRTQSSSSSSSSSSGSSSGSSSNAPVRKF